MKTLTQIIAKSRSKVMRTAWHLHRVTGFTFSECLKKAWQIIKTAFSRIELTTGMCFLENKQNVFRIIDRPVQEINKEMTKNIVFLVEVFIKETEIMARKAAAEKANAEIRATHNAVVADSMINNYKFD